MNNMSKIRIINIKDNGYKTIRLISKRFKVKYYDPPVSDTIIEFCIQIKFPYMISLINLEQSKYILILKYR